MNSKRQMRWITIFAAFLILAGCGSLNKQASLINYGYSKDQVLKIMGPPDDQQFKGHNEAWQYCQTGAGFGYHDYRIVWFYNGKVTGITSYKTSGPRSCVGGIRPIDWEEAPDLTIELRER